MRMLLVSPRTPDTFWSFKHALPFVAEHEEPRLRGWENMVRIVGDNFIGNRRCTRALLEAA
jgi:hypothetical protein